MAIRPRMRLDPAQTLAATSWDSAVKCRSINVAPGEPLLGCTPVNACTLTSKPGDRKPELTEVDASTRLSPFVRWAGSKRLLSKQIVEHLPEEFGAYFEPFLGGGSVLLATRPRNAVVGDALAPLVTTWKVIRDDCDGLMDELNRHGFDKTVYEAMKQLEPASDVEVAARFMILNRGAYGGLWRVNARGAFNVPWSQPKSPSPTSEANVRAVSEYLRNSEVHIQNADFQAITMAAKAGDLVFFDPPYSRTITQRPFVHYQEKLFDWDEQTRLAKEARRLVDLGASVLLTNSPHPDIRELYPDFAIVDVVRHSALGSTATRSTTIAERIFISH